MTTATTDNLLPGIPTSRREMLRRCGAGFGMLGLTGVLQQAGLLDQTARAAGPSAIAPLAPREPHFGGKAKHVVHLFMNGGPSHVDTFDRKPLLEKHHGKPLPTQNFRTERKTGAAMGSPFKLKEVFMMTGTSVNSPKRSIRRW